MRDLALHRGSTSVSTLPEPKNKGRIGSPANSNSFNLFWACNKSNRRMRPSRASRSCLPSVCLGVGFNLFCGAAFRVQRFWQRAKGLETLGFRISGAVLRVCTMLLGMNFGGREPGYRAYQTLQFRVSATDTQVTGKRLGNRAVFRKVEATQKSQPLHRQKLRVPTLEGPIAVPAMYQAANPDSRTPKLCQA